MRSYNTSILVAQFTILNSTVCYFQRYSLCEKLHNRYCHKQQCIKPLPEPAYQLSMGKNLGQI